MRTKLNKIKIFSDENIANLEKKINSWFNKNRYIEIVQILQSETMINLESDSIGGSLVILSFSLAAILTPSL